LVSHCDSAFGVWNTLTSLEQQMTNNGERESSGDESDQACFMVQEIDSLEVNSDTQLDNCASFSCHNNAIDAYTLNEELIHVLWKLAFKVQNFEKQEFWFIRRK